MRILKVWERTVLTVLKSNFCVALTTAKKVDVVLKTAKSSFSRLKHDGNLPAVKRVILKVDFKTVNTLLSQTFNPKIFFEYAIRSQLSGFLFNAKI